jgi:hypothetical protein
MHTLSPPQRTPATAATIVAVVAIAAVATLLAAARRKQLVAVLTTNIFLL